MLWKEKFLDKNMYTRPAVNLKKVRKIIIHDTANPGATALNHFHYFNGTARRVKRYASAHIFIDAREAYCIIPLHEIAYHANDGRIRKIEALKPNANMFSLGIELCLTKDGKIDPKTVARAVDIVYFLCKKYKLAAKDVVRHFDVTGKNCPGVWVKNPQLFRTFIGQVARNLAMDKK